MFWGSDAAKIQDVDAGAFASWLVRAEQEQRLGADPATLVGSCQAQVRCEPAALCWLALERAALRCWPPCR